MTDEWERGHCSYCSGRAKRVPNSPQGTWTHDGVPMCRGTVSARFVPEQPAPQKVIDLRDPVMQRPEDIG